MGAVQLKPKIVQDTSSFYISPTPSLYILSPSPLAVTSLSLFSLPSTLQSPVRPALVRELKAAQAELNPPS